MKFIRFELIFIAILISIAYYFSSTSKNITYSGKTIEEYYRDGARNVGVNSENDITVWYDSYEMIRQGEWQPTKGKTKYRDSAIDWRLLARILVYGVSINLIILALFFFRQKKVKNDF